MRCFIYQYYTGGPEIKRPNWNSEIYVFKDDGPSRIVGFFPNLNLQKKLFIIDVSFGEK